LTLACRAFEQPSSRFYAVDPLSFPDFRARAEGRMSATRFMRAALVAAGIVAYQLAAHHAVATPGEHGLGLMLVIVPLLIFALSAAARSPWRAWLLPLWALVCAGLWTMRASLTQHFGWGLYLEHVAFNLALAWMFGRTLAAGREPLCTHFARMVHGTLEPRVERYTRRVTLAWTLLFVGVALVSTILFATASIVAWSTFANYLALPLVALMFVAEYGCRRIALPDMQQSGVLASVRAYRNHTPMKRSSAQ
jgi:uncharacterized membrane protein